MCGAGGCNGNVFLGQNFADLDPTLPKGAPLATA
jgi:hypothetical protein